MIGNVFRLLVSVRAKLFFSFLAMTLLIAALGGMGVFAAAKSGAVVKTTFDRPLMAINYARSAGQRFTELSRDIQYADLPLDDAEFLYEIFAEDLAVARERNLSDRAVDFFDKAEAASGEYMTAVRSGGADMAALQIIAQSVASDLEIIVELQSGESFKAREAALGEVETLRRLAMLAVLSALILTAGLSTWLGLTILKPLSAAAHAARSIADGQLNTEIPQGRRDETGALLYAMRKMRNTIRERMEREMHEKDLAQDRLAESLNNSQDAVLIANPGGRIILANAQVGALFPELAYHPILDAPVNALFNANGLPLFGQYKAEGDRQFMSADGRWCRVNASRTREGGTLLIWTDITQDRQIRAQLEDTMQEALAANTAKSDFLASMSHELRTPLNAIIGFADVLRTEALGPIGPTDYVDMAGHIRHSGDMLLSIFEDILEMSRGDQTKTAVKGKPIDFSEALRRSVRTYGPKADAKSISLRYSEPSDPVTVLSNMVDLERLTNKILSNAVKFTPEGGRIDVALSVQPAGDAVLRITDSGVGIAVDILPSICEPFVQAESGTTRTYEGVGLGLTVAKRLIDKHGGTLAIQSDHGQGTTAFITFPLHQALSQPRCGQNGRHRLEPPARTDSKAA